MPGLRKSSTHRKAENVAVSDELLRQASATSKSETVSMIPKKALQEITRRAQQQWPHDREMQGFCITEESDAYIALSELDFGELAHAKEQLLCRAHQLLDSWDDIWRYVREEVASYRELNNLNYQGISAELLEVWKGQAETAHEQSYDAQLGFVTHKAQKYMSILRTGEQVDPIKSLLIEMENIIGNECYNGNIQNYASWGELESEGRKFRYPVTFRSEQKKTKSWMVTERIPSEDLITGYYAFGANELNVYRALVKIVVHLEENYGLDITRK